jgi:hypothetical protein
MVWSLWIFDVRFQYWSGSGQTGYKGASSGFWGTNWVKHAEVQIHDLKNTCSAFQRLLKHTFPMPTATVMAISVQPRAELVICWKIRLSNGLEVLAQLRTTTKLWLFSLVIELGWLGHLVKCKLGLIILTQTKYNYPLLRIVRTWCQNALNIVANDLARVSVPAEDES